MKFSITLMAILVIPMLTSGQEGFKGEHFIEVTGVSQMEIEPNEIYVMVRLKEFEENRQKVTLEKLEKDFNSALKEAGIDRKRLELSDAGSSLGKIGKRDKDAFREKTFQIKLTSAAELEKFIEKLQSVEVDLVDVTRLHHSDYEKIKLDLKTKALQAARLKAETLVKSIGAEIGKPLMVRDWEADPMPMTEMKANIRMRSNTVMDQAQVDEPVAFRKIKLQAQITAQFEIK